MNQVWTIELYVYLTTAFCSLVLLPRSANWRLRLVIGTVGLQALAQSVTQIRLNHPFWQSRLGTVTGIVEMFGGALALTAIYLLKKENSERKSTDARLRLSEAEEKQVKAGRPFHLDDLSQAVPVVATAKDAAPLTASLDRLQEAVRESGRPALKSLRSRRNAEPGSELRKARRFPISLFARVTRLGGEQHTFECEIADISQGGARLCMPESLQIGDLVKIEYRDFLFLGEVCRCEEADGRHVAGVQFEHMVNVAILSRMLREMGYEAKEVRAIAQTA